MPVLAGGRAFGPDDLRARRLGADGWAPTPTPPAASWERGAASRRGGQAACRHARRRAAGARGGAARAGRGGDERAVPCSRPWLATAQTQLARTREDLGYILQFLEAALLTDDARLFLEEFLPWLTGVLTPVACPPAWSPLAWKRSVPCWTRFRAVASCSRGRQLAADRALDG